MQKSAIDFKNTILVLAVIIFLITMNSWGYLQRPKNSVMFLFAPIISGFESSSGIFGNLIYSIRKIDSFKTENEKLEAENRDLSFKLSQMNETQNENADLRKQLQFKNDLCSGTDCINFAVGNVIDRSSDSYEKSIMINLGSAEGAKNGGAVTISGGIMIGKIAETFDHYSKVILITSPESSVNCLDQNTRANGLLRGKYNTGVKLEMIDQSEGLAEGDMIITSGLEPGIPKGLLLGKISSIEQSPNTVFKSADIELFSDMSNIEKVFLVK
jgi:rod shape-determining protein MreC